MPEAKTKGADYSATVNLPKTEFPMKGDLPKREPLLLQFWSKINLYGQMRERQQERKPFVLHDGPPYANGNIHIGHALNKILKDMVVKSRALMGYATPYVPGWDCHGLPIETALLKEMKMSKRGVKDIPAFRKNASDFAEKFIAIQKEEFKRLGGVGDWDKPYKTMSREYEAKVLQAFRQLLSKDYIYRGLKPVYWCITCETALAEAEIEYKDKTSPSIYVAFPIHKANFKELEGAEVLVWTTTPWTLPANMAAAFHANMEYVLIEARLPTSAKPRRLLLAKSRLEAVLTAISAAEHKILGSWLGKELAPSPSPYPSPPEGGRGQGEGDKICFAYERPFGDQEGIGILAEHVTAEDGTGIVHTAPGHGVDDFYIGQKYGLEVVCPVDGSGRFTDKAGDLAGKQVFKEGNPEIIARLSERGWLLAQKDIQHRYAHCWRCKNPIIYRATEQWFLSVNEHNLRQKLLTAVAETQWVPEMGRARISGMVETRPDWCLSRQRVWGTPIPVLFCTQCAEPLKDDGVLKAIEEKVAKDSDNFWFENWGEEISIENWGFLPKDTHCRKCSGKKFRRETDILDVWMDSGASWLAVLNSPHQPSADLYLEGSDQHRGWFQSSLVLATALTGRAPYKTVLTHGFVLDEHGRAMHKSAGNVVAPQEVIDKLGADVLRLWVAFSDYNDDVRISDKLLEVPTESYRKFRNTARYLLGNCFDFNPSKDAVALDQLPELERYVLGRLALMQKEVIKDYREFQFRQAARRLIDFCAFDLSSFYLDIIKDRLYTFPAADPLRRASQTVMAQCLECLLLLAAPILSFTTEEAWQMGPKAWGKGESVFLADLLGSDTGSDPVSDPNMKRWDDIRKIRETVLKTLEEARAAKKIGSSLQAKVTLKGQGLNLLDAPHWCEVLLVSQINLLDGTGEFTVEVETIKTPKCSRCWRYPSDVGSSPVHPELCGRCAKHLS